MSRTFHRRKPRKRVQPLNRNPVMAQRWTIRRDLRNPTEAYYMLSALLHNNRAVVFFHDLDSDTFAPGKSLTTYVVANRKYSRFRRQLETFATEVPVDSEYQAFATIYFKQVRKQRCGF